MAQGSFSAQVSAFAGKTRARRDAVFRESTQRIIEIMQTPVAEGGNMPVDTGYLRASLQALLGEDAPVLTFKPDGDGVYRYDLSATSLVIAEAKWGDTITAAYTANYAVYVEYGARGHAGRGFVRLAAQQWPQIVDQVCAEVKSRTG